MKTTNYGIDLMVSGQVGNNEIIFNEAVLKMDNFLNSVIKGFVKSTPENLDINEKYIITDGKYIDHICYIVNTAKNIEYIPVKNSMIFFVIEENSFFLYDNSTWKKLSFSKD